jgi:hypothetical protein
MYGYYPYNIHYAKRMEFPDVALPAVVVCRNTVYKGH